MGHVECMELRNTYKILIKSPKVKRPLRGGRRRIEVYLKEISCELVGCVKLGQVRVQ